MATRHRLRRWFWRHVRRYAYEICQRCGRPASTGLGDTYWFAPNPLWNEVNGSPNGIRCPRCFHADAKAKGIPVAWMAGPVGGGIEDWLVSMGDVLACSATEPCGRTLVGQGTDTWDPNCVLPSGHAGACQPEGEES